MFYCFYLIVFKNVSKYMYKNLRVWEIEVMINLIKGTKVVKFKKMKLQEIFLKWIIGCRKGIESTKSKLTYLIKLKLNLNWLKQF